MLIGRLSSIPLIARGIKELKMAGLLTAEPSHHGTPERKPEECGGRWYFSRKEIEENSPSRRDGIDLKKETYLRKSYCTFLQDLGMRLKVYVFFSPLFYNMVKVSSAFGICSCSYILTFLLRILLFLISHSFFPC